MDEASRGGTPRVLGTISAPSPGNADLLTSWAVLPLDPAAFSEGFCPNCRVPLGGDARNWCPRCRAFWNAVPQEAAR